jgi:hypothetical protein
MDCFPSPPSSPYLEAFPFDQQNHHVICGACNKPLGADWFCSDCHKKCTSCNRFLGQDEHCSRCYTFDPVSQQYLRKHQSSFINYYRALYPRYHYSHFSGLPSPSNSTGSETKGSHNI